MALIPWKTKREDSGGELATRGGFRNELDRLFDSFVTDAFGWGREWPASAIADLPLDIEETDHEISVRAEIPGVSPEDLQVSINGKMLIISGEKKETQEKLEGAYFYQERRFGSFRREVPLPVAVDPDNVQAEYKDGVLHVTLKKAQEALPKRIEVRSG
jgi:HSP20 family protein